MSGRNLSTDLARQRGRRQLLLLAALFFVPLASAFWLYYGPGDWRPAGGTNQGDLVDPAVPLPDVVLAQPGGTTTPPGWLRGRWTILYLGPGECDERCRKALYLSRQTRLALNKDIDRVQRVFLATAPCCADLAAVVAEHPDLVIAILGDDAGSRSLMSAVPAPSDVPASGAGRHYLVDPLGNLVLSYGPTAPDKALLGDLRRLLKLSHIG